MTDNFRNGHILESGFLAKTPRPTRDEVLDRMKSWQSELDYIADRTERLIGRLEACNEWLAQHPEGMAS